MNIIVLPVCALCLHHRMPAAMLEIQEKELGEITGPCDGKTMSWNVSVKYFSGYQNTANLTVVKP